MSASNNTSDDYYLQRSSWSSSARLSYQHYVYRERYGFLIHPDISAALALDTSNNNSTSSTSTSTNNADNPNEHPSEPLRILDFATGNGVWALDIAQQLSKTTNRQIDITALDISPAQFPPPTVIPSNVSFGTHDIFADVPSSLLGKFDIIHVRLLIAAMLKPGSEDIAVANLAKMLKGKGWLQWQEIEEPATYEIEFKEGEVVRKSEATPVLDCLEKHMGFMTRQRWPNELDKLMRKGGGLVETKMVRPEVKRWLIQDEGWVMLWTWRETMGGLEGLLPGEEARGEFRGAVGEYERMVGERRLFRYASVMAVGRKP